MKSCGGRLLWIGLGCAEKGLASPKWKRKSSRHRHTYAAAITIGNIGDVSNHSNVAVGHHAQAGSPIDPTELQKLLAEIRTYALGIIGPEDQRGVELRAAMAELDDAVQSTPIASSKLRQPLLQILKVVGNAGQTVITAGLKLYVEQWMKLHGLAP